MTSIAARAKGASLVKGFNGAIQAQVLALAEYQVTRHASSNPNFVRAAEGGVFDCGIWVGDEALVGSMTDKFFQITGSNRRSVVPAEIKSVTPKSDHKGNVWWRINLSAVQYDRGGAIFITSPYEPDFVAVVPMEYIRRRTTRRSGDRIQLLEFKGFRPDWTLHAMPAFPPELHPFMMPINRLGDAVGAIRDFTKGTSQSWSGTGVLR